MSADKRLLGQKLTPGSEHAMDVELETAGRIGNLGGTIRVWTDPAGDTPAECYVSVDVDGPPEPIGTLPLRIQGGNEAPFETTLVFRHDRAPSRPAVMWDEALSELADFRVVHADVNSRLNSPTHGSMVGTGHQDVIRLTLRSVDPLPIGRHSRTLMIHWRDHRYPPNRVPLEIEVQAPLRLSLERVFFGVLEPGTPSAVNVPVLNWDPQRMHDVRLESDHPLVTAELDRATGVIRAGLSDQVPVGRLAATIRVHWAAGATTLTIPVTAVVSAAPLTTSGL
jgi:hypothetical protein